MSCSNSPLKQYFQAVLDIDEGQELDANQAPADELMSIRAKPLRKLIGFDA